MLSLPPVRFLQQRRRATRRISPPEPRRIVGVRVQPEASLWRISFFSPGPADGTHETFLGSGDLAFDVAGYQNDGRFSEEYWDELPKPLGWLPAKALQEHQQARTGSGLMKVSVIDPIWRTRTAGIGWISPSPDGELGHLIDLREGRVDEQWHLSVFADYLGVEDFGVRYESPKIAAKWAYKGTLYHLEVEDSDAYEVGAAGVLVRAAV